MMQPLDLGDTNHISSILHNITNSTGSNASSHAWTPEEHYPAVWIYFSPILFTLGVIGNTLTFLVMRRPRMRGTTTSVYLRWLAVADTMALLTRIGPEFFSAIQLFTFSELNRWTCKLEKFLFYTSSDVAIWILVTFTFDRFLAVCFPFLRHSALGRPRRADFNCILIVLLACGKNLHVFWTRGPVLGPNNTVLAVCGRPEAYYIYEQLIRPWIAFVLISVIPFCVIITCNIAIVRTLLRARYRRRHTSARMILSQRSYVSNSSSNGRVPHGRGSGLPQGRGSGVPQSSNGSAASRGIFTQTTLMSLSASAAFLVCVTPSIILTIGRVRWSEEPHRDAYYLARAITHQLSCFNHAINFFLYCLSGQKFRRELLVMLRLRKPPSIYHVASRLISSRSSQSYTTRSQPNSPDIIAEAKALAQS